MIKVSIKSATELFKGLIGAVNDAGQDPNIDEWESLLEFWKAFPAPVRENIVKDYTEEYQNEVHTESIIVVLNKRLADETEWDFVRWAREYKHQFYGLN